MKTIQCAHPPHHHNGFVATCRLWTASGRVHALLVLEPTYVYIYKINIYYIYINHTSYAQVRELPQTIDPFHQLRL